MKRIMFNRVLVFEGLMGVLMKMSLLPIFMGDNCLYTDLLMRMMMVLILNMEMDMRDFFMKMPVIQLIAGHRSLSP